MLIKRRTNYYIHNLRALFIQHLVIRKRIKSFYYAFKGLFYLIVSEKNAWIHAAATISVCSAGFYYNLTGTEWCLITVAIITVWAAEAINTAFENLADALSPEHNPLIARAKDIAACAVLVTAAGAVVIGILIFGPYIFR